MISIFLFSFISPVLCPPVEEVTLDSTFHSFPLSSPRCGLFFFIDLNHFPSCTDVKRVKCELGQVKVQEFQTHMEIHILYDVR